MTRMPSSKQQGFAEWLAGLNKPEKRGTLAALRRGLMLEEEQLYELYGQIPPNFLAGLRQGEERLYLMVAALFASHPEAIPAPAEGERRVNLGESLRRLAAAKAAPGTPSDELLPEALKRRLEATLNAPRDELFGHLRQLVSLLKTEEIPVDWAKLLYDIQGWDLEWRPVQWEWSRSFYVGFQKQEGDESHVS
jgi:CRISPR system Cascade subunit CasB